MTEYLFGGAGNRPAQTGVRPLELWCPNSAKLHGNLADREGEIMLRKNVCLQEIPSISWQPSQWTIAKGTE